MNETPTDLQRVQTFRDNLGAVLRDLTHRRPIHLFFDARNVWNALLGIESINTADGRFDRSRFDDKSTLVEALASAGWLGDIRMLVPHQLELWGLTESRMHVTSNESFAERARAFLAAVQQQPSDDLHSRTGSAIEEVERFLEDTGVPDRDRFKGLEAIRFGLWEQRLIAAQHSDSSPWLRFDVPTDVAALPVGEEFQRLHRALSDHRPGDKWWKSNVNDASALAVVLRMVQDDSAPLPRLYDPGNLFYQTIRDAGLEEAFTWTNDEGNRDCAIRSHDYFRARALFSRVLQGAADTPEARAQLETLYQQLLDYDPVLFETSFEQLHLARSIPLSKLISDLESGSFLEYVWEPFSRKKDVESIIRQLHLRSEASGRTAPLREQLSNIRQALLDNVRDYKHLLEAVRATETLSRELLRSGTPDAPNSHARRFGLLRYALPVAALDAFNHACESLMRADRIHLEQVQRDVVDALCSDDETRLAFAAALLVAQDKNVLLVDLIDTKCGDDIDNSRLRFVLAATCLRLDSSRSRGEELVDRLRRQQDSGVRQGQELALEGYPAEAVATAYLCFRRLRLSNMPMFSALPLDATRITIPDELAPFVADCLRYSRRAVDSLQHGSSDLLLYAINIELYYMAELCTYDAETARRMDMLSQMLTRHRKERGDARDEWDYRYYDTRARYLRRCAMAVRRKKRGRLLRQALDELNIGIRRMPERRDDDLVELERRISLEIDSL